MTTRRTVLKAMLTAGAAQVFVGKLEGLLALAQTSLPMRRSLHGMALDDPDLDAYRTFVGLMLAKDQSKPASWLGFSLQHGTYGGGYKYCPHGDWYFLPWHRAFVVMYENAVRTLTGHTRFAMPYWDWTVDRSFPQAFNDATYKGKPNPLYVQGRTLTDPTRWPLPDSIVGPSVIAKIYSETDFQAFGTSKNPSQNNLDMSWVVKGGGIQGTLEKTPHNNIHNFIGKYMPSAGSPRDPIFMMHHGNIDRIWAYWNGLGRSNTSGMDPATQKLWLEMNFNNNYLRPDGTPYSAVVKNVQDIKALGYTYDNLPKAPDKVVFDAVRSKRLHALFASAPAMEGMQVLRAPNHQAATPAKPLRQEAKVPRAVVTEKVPEGRRAPEVYALIRDMVVSPGVESVRVFVNAPQVNSKTPDTDPHFVDQIGILLHSEKDEHHKAPPSALVDLTPALRNLAKLGQLQGDTISVVLLPVPRPGASQASVSAVPASIEIAVL
ncbi:MAG: tyrosinase family protein [Thermoanaerobaculia bacterium]